jgi:hypothetical protein
MLVSLAFEINEGKISPHYSEIPAMRKAITDLTSAKLDRHSAKNWGFLKTKYGTTILSI